jgi:hypothetical protein
MDSDAALNNEIFPGLDPAAGRAVGPGTAAGSDPGTVPGAGLRADAH